MELIQQFIDHLGIQKKPASKATVKNYKADISQFVLWYEEYFGRKFNPQKVTQEVIKTYQTIKTQQISARSVERHISSLKKFFQFLKLNGFIGENPLFPRENNQSQDPWKMDEFKSFLHVYNSSPLTIKNYIMDAKQFLSWAEKVTGTDQAYEISEKDVFTKISSRLIQEYKERLLTDTELSPLSINRKLSAIRRYISWAEGADLIKSNSILQATTNLPSSGAQTVKDAGDQESQTPETQSDDNKIVQYSKFPPLRLAQKTFMGVNHLFDWAVVGSIAQTVEKVTEHTQPKEPLFVAAEGQVQRLALLTHATDGIKPAHVENVKKSFYAPHSISTAHFPFHKKVWHHAKHTRPDWYRKYHSYPVTHYFHFGILMIFMAIIGISLYQSLFAETAQRRAALAAAVAPPRVLSFQGRLTDTDNSPITSAKDITFAVYTASTGSGSAYLWSETQEVTPDEDGVFSVLLGESETIPQSVFAENDELYLGIAIDGEDELSPRQQLATVAFATNAEVLQGLPPITQSGAGVRNVVLALNSSGDLSIGGNAEPTFSATGGRFTISGQTLLLKTNSGSNTNVQIAPDGTGVVDIVKSLQNTSDYGSMTTTKGAVEVADMFAVIATSSSQSAVTINQNGTSPILSASSSGTAKFTLYNDGSAYFAGNVGIGVTTPSSFGLETAGSIGPTTDATYDLGSASKQFRNLYLSGTTTAAGNITISNSAPTLTLEDTTSSEDDWNINADSNTFRVRNTTDGVNYLAIDGSGVSTFTGNVVPATTATYDLGTSSLKWNNIYVNTISSAGTSSSGQAIFTYNPAATTVAESTVLINPTTADANDILLTTAIGGAQKFGVDYEGDIVVGYNSSTAPGVSDPLNVYNHGTTRVAYIDTSGNVTTSGTTITASSLTSLTTGAAFTISGTSYVKIGDSGTPSMATADDDLYVQGQFEVDGISNFTGNVGIGTTTPTLDQLQISSSDSSLGIISVDDSNSSVLNLRRARSGTAIVNSGNTLGQVAFRGYDGASTYVTGALIYAQVDGTPGATDMPGRLIFGTTADGGSSVTERMRIDSSGNIGMAGHTSPDAFLNIASTTDQDLFRVDDNGDGDTSPFIIKSDGNVGIGITAPLALLHVGTGGTPSLAATGDAYIQNDLEVDGNARFDTNIATGITPSSNTNFQLGTAITAASGTGTSLMVNNAITASANSDVIQGEYIVPQLLAGTATSVTGYALRVGTTFTTGSGGFANQYGIHVAPTYSVSDTNYGINIDAVSGGTTNYALRIQGTAASGNNFSIYADSTAQNYLAGNLGLGTTNPSTRLWVGTGGTPGVASTGDAYIQNDLEVDGVLNIGGDTTLVGDLAINGDDLTSDGTLTIDAATDIQLDADGADIVLLDNGTEFGRFTNNSTALEINSAGSLVLADTTINLSGGTTTFQVSGTGELTLSASAFSPATSDSNALGTTSLMWSDLFLASGGVINFNAGDVTITHGTDTLGITGGNVGIGTNSPSSRFNLAIPPTSTLAAAGVSGILQDAHSTTLTGSDPTTYATIYASQIGAMTLAGTNANQTVTDAAGLVVAPAIKSTNVAITNTHGILVPATAVSTATNAYGLTVNAPTGATNNYTAALLGGNVGVGVTNPGANLEVKPTTDSTSVFSVLNSSGSTALKLDTVSETAVALFGVNTTPLAALHAARDYATDNTTSRTVLLLDRTYSGGVGAAGIGANMLFRAETSTSGVLNNAARVGGGLTGVTDGAANGYLHFDTQNAGTMTEWMRIISTGNVGMAGQTTPDAFLNIASTTNQDLFRVDDNGDGDTSPFIVKADGNVGVGVTNPAYSLTVSGRIQVAHTGTTGPQLLSTANKITFRNDNDVSDADIQAYSGAFTGTTSSYFTGNLGIGVVSPNAKLAIGNNVATGFLDNYSEYQQILYDGGTASSSFGFGIKASTMVFNSANGAYSFDKSGTSTLVQIDTSGNLGVGDTTPDAMFTVGSTSQFQVNSSGAVAASTGINSSGGYTQSGTTANTFTGATTFSASGTALTVNNNATITGTSQLTGAVTLSSGTTTLNHGTANIITWGTSGVATPAFTTRSAGAKVVLYSALSGSSADYAIGVESGRIWSGVPTTGDGFKWYGGTTLAAELSGGGNLTLVGNCSDAAGGGGCTADYAEAYQKDLSDPMEKGDLLAIDPATGKVTRASSSNTSLVGIYSTAPGSLIGQRKNSIQLGVGTKVMDDLDPDEVPVALSGRVPTKVSTENGAIFTGDYLTVSDTQPGIAVKATRPGPTVGKALEDYTGNGIGKIEVYVNVSYADPNSMLAKMSIDANGTLPTIETSNGQYVATKANGTLADQVVAFAKTFSAQITAGYVHAQALTVAGLVRAQEVTTQTLVATTATLSEVTSNNIVSPIASIDILRTNLITPLGSASENIGIRIAQDSVSILNGTSTSSATVASFDNQGNATFSGELTAESGEFGLVSGQDLVVSNDATVSGTLRAKNIIAESIDGLEARIATIAANTVKSFSSSASNSATMPFDQNTISQWPVASSDFIEIASFSAGLARIENLSTEFVQINQSLAVLGPTSMTSVSVADQLAVGGNFVITDSSLNTLGSTLEIQPLRQGAISFMSGALFIDVTGQVTVTELAVFAKNVQVHGNLSANILSPIGSDLAVNLASSSSQFKVTDASGSAKFAVNNVGDVIASGAATISKLNFNLVQPALATSLNEAIATGSAGTATVVANERELTIRNSLVTNNSLIYITPVGTGSATAKPYLLRQVAGDSFTVGVDAPSLTDTLFNWLIIN